MTTLGTCDVCARLIELTPAGTLRRHATVGPIIRARVGKLRKQCRGSGRWPRRAEP